MSWGLAREVVDVLRRPKFERYGLTSDAIDHMVGTWGPLLPTVDIRVEMRDPNDAPVVAAALAGQAQAIITGDLDFLDDDGLRAWLLDRGVKVLTPPGVMERL